MTNFSSGRADFATLFDTAIGRVASDVYGNAVTLPQFFEEEDLGPFGLIASARRHRRELSRRAPEGAAFEPVMREPVRAALQGY